MATEEVVTPGSGVVLGLFVPVVAGPAPGVLLTPVVLMELTEPVELVDGMTVVVSEVLSSEEFSEEQFTSHNHFCSMYLQSLLFSLPK